MGDVTGREDLMGILHKIGRELGIVKPKRRKKRRTPPRKKNGEFKKG